MLEKIKEFVTKKLFIWGVIIIIVLLGGFYFYSKNNQVEYSLVSPEVSDLKQSIKIAGIVKPAEEVSLNFEISGRIEKINLKVEDEIKKDQELIILENKEARARIARASAQVSSANSAYRQSEAQLMMEQSKLDELIRGPRTESVDLSQSKLSATKQALADSQRNLQLVKDKASNEILSILNNVQSQLQQAYVEADSAINQYSAGIFINEQSTNPTLSFTTANQQDKIMAESYRVQVKEQLQALRDLSLVSVTSNESKADGYLKDAHARLLIVVTSLDYVKAALNGSVSLSTTDLNNYKTNVNLARNNVLAEANSVISLLNTLKTQRVANANLISSAETSVSAAQNSVLVAERELQVVLSGSSKEELRAQESLVSQRRLSIDASRANLASAQASLMELQAGFDKTILKAPFDGRVTKVNATVGQLVSGGMAGASTDEGLISVISKAGLQIEVNIPEVDITKVAIGNKVTVTVDAYGETVEFEGVILTIESGESLVNGVPTYKTIIQFTKQDERLKPGMTANLDITTAKVDRVLSLPVRAIIFDNGKNYVEVVTGVNEGKIKKEKIEVEVGLKSSDGKIEIKSGLTESDQVVIQP
jgi:RND family efflux transporter MFP subunit